MKADKTLIFVYNADSGLWNAVLDSLHKTLSPKTYSCNLCAITYGTLTMKNDWKNFIEQLTVPSRFLHKDEWLKEFGRKDDLPALFVFENDQIDVLINAKKMNTLSIDGLKQTIIESF